jgi:hypothetical protein
MNICNSSNQFQTTKTHNLKNPTRAARPFGEKNVIQFRSKKLLSHSVIGKIRSIFSPKALKGWANFEETLSF